ncbi:hypothetical protein jaqu_02550 [Jannaschia aquimarina]|uniref:Uncharacterized protein n=1 Tax=Jannaschia aquimarina TaxID=935700 RepID=A0A0D1CT74_9RHOB|nr:hypothetical protein [Jannaschia aquimarina]KIT17967.1 hypothetical protein jaqu_02550 [Jannaschia aquimarina]
MIVRASLEDTSGDRCVDLIEGEAGWAWVECRRDPEDGHGWRRLHPPRGGFADRTTAERDAGGVVGWMGAPDS